MASKRLRGGLAASLLVMGLGCGATASVPPLVPPDGGSNPICPSGPSTTTSPTTTLPSGACSAGDGPCDYEGTPCPSVVNGTVYGYVCTCQSGTWDCETVNQTGLCAPLPDDAGDGSYLFLPDTGAPDAGEDAGTSDAAK